MKKSFKALALLSACLCGTTVFAGCGLFGGGEGGGGSGSKTKYEFSIQYGEEQNKYSFENKDNIHVDPRHQEGYVLDGFYTQPNGAGTKMLNWDGSCLSSSFSGDGSTVLYPNYKEIDYTVVYKSPIWYDEDPKSTSYNVYGDPQMIYSVISKLAVDSKEMQYLLAFSAANPRAKLEITATSELKGSTGKFYVGIGKDVDKSNLLNSISVSGSSSYRELTVSTVINAKALTISGSSLLVGIYCNKFGNSINYKNLQETVSIVKPEEEETPDTDTDTGTETETETTQQ